MCDLKRFETSLQKCQGRPLMDDLTQTYPRPGVRSDLSQKPLSIHAVCVCARGVHMCVFTPVMDRELVLQGPQKNSSSMIQLPQQAELEGQQEARGQHAPLHTSFLTQG